MSGTATGFSTPTNRRLAGVTYCTIEGSAYNVVSYSWAPSGVENETMTSLSGIDGYKSTPRPGHIELELRDAQGVSVTSFANMTDATVILNLANGKSIQGHDVWNVPLPEVQGAEATFRVRFEGDNITEQGSTA